MTVGNGPGGADGCTRDAAAYVLGALDSAEAEEFRLHLATCAVCRDEVAALGSAADALALAAPQIPVPRALRRRVMAAVRASGEAAGSRRSPRRAAARTPSRRVALAGAGALAILAGVIAVVVIGGGSKAARTLRASVAVPSASATVRLAAGRGELDLRRMPPAPVGHIYEVWLQRGHGPPLPTSVLFNVTSSGAAEVGLPGDLRGVRAVLVTAERLGGSLRPTRAPVIVARLS